MSLKLNMFVKSVGVINNNIEEKILSILLWSFGALALLYIIFLGNMVSNIVERKGLEAESRTLSNDVGSLELTYLSMTNGIDLALSQSMGFKETKATFATRKSLGLKTDGSSPVKIVQNEL